MRILTAKIVLLMLLTSLAGCSKVVVRSDSDPNVDLSTLDTLYVRKLPADSRGIELIITNKLNDFGFKAVSGVANQPGRQVDAIVTYEDRWMWDITMYMLSLDIQIRHPDTDYIMASGSSYRTSLARKSPEEMVDEILREIFSGKKPLPERQDK